MFRRFLRWLNAIADTSAAKLETERYRALYEAEHRARLQAEREAIDRLFTVRELREALKQRTEEIEGRRIVWGAPVRLRAIPGGKGRG